MIVLVTGGRDFYQKKYIYNCLDEINFKTPISLVVHGSATGADSISGQWADDRGIKQQRFKITQEEWKKYGRSAGPLRNDRMLKESKPDLVVAFPGHNGTEGMKGLARRAGVRVEECIPGKKSPLRVFAREPNGELFNHLCIVGDMATAEDMRLGGPFTWNCKDLLDTVARETGFSIDHSLLTYVFMEPAQTGNPLANFRSMRMAKKEHRKINQDIPVYYNCHIRYFLLEEHTYEISRLKAELYKWKPRITLALGSLATWALTGQSDNLDNWRGTYLFNQLVGYGYVLPTFSLNSVSYDKNRFEYIIEDFKLAVNRVKIKLPTFVNYDYHIYKPTSELRHARSA